MKVVEQWLSRHQGHLFLVLLWLLSLGIVFYLARRPRPEPLAIIPPAQPMTPTPHPLRVDVTGAVVRPGVYTLPPDSIVRDAVLAAGGGTEAANLAALNQAARLADGMQVYVPSKEESQAQMRPLIVTSSPPQPQTATNTGTKVNINTATLDELDTLPGIGPALAQRIIDGRPYRTIEDIIRVQGIGPNTFERFKDLITVE